MTAELLCLHERFESQVAATPDGVALTFAGEHLSYRALNERANRLAAYLRERGVGPERRVGLCLDRSFDTIVAILAVLKAGGAYVPMDPVYPAERVRMIVEDAECPVVLVHAAHAGQFDGEGGAVLIVLDGADRPWESGPAENLACTTTPQSLAYVIYTSGSTGRPKGALISHWNVYRLVTEMEPWFDVGPADVWTLFHSYAFDFSVWEMWGAFFYGGRLLVVPYLVSRSPDQFYQMLLDEGVTVLNQTPSAFKQLQHHDETVPLETARGLALRYVIFGGETLDMPGLAPWFERHGDQKPHLVNMYGITETTVFVTYRPVSMADTEPGTPNFIGIPIPDLTLYVLDEHRRPVAVGEVGELFVGGDGVGQGYLKRPELTAERFVPDPLADDPAGGTIFYKTGDLVRVWEGDLEFLGRNDMQVQLRGFRVELGEIESALNLHPEVRGAVVRMREDTPGDQRLAAYYLAREPVPAHALREHLGTTLPSYMVPSAFVHMAAFPLNNNGKIDDGALPAPGARPSGETVYVAPRNANEAALAGIWQELLGVQELGIHDDFAAAGGHSLLATALAVHIHARFQVKLPLRLLLESPTIAELAEAIDTASAAGHLEDLAAPARAPRDQPIPLSFAQEQLWILEQLHPGMTAYNVTMSVDLAGPVVPTTLEAALATVVRRHEVLRTVFEARGGVPEQRVLDDMPVPFEYVSLQDTPDAERAGRFTRLAMDLERESFDLAAGPLLRAVLVEMAPDHHRMALVIHHIVFDGWSVSVLLDELATAYGRLSSDRDGDRPPQAYQFADYAVWQRAQAAAPAFEAHLDYWRGKLAGPLPVIEAPCDFERPPVQSWDGAVVYRDLSPYHRHGVEELARRQNVTPFVVMLAAWKALLYRYTGQEDCIVGAAMAGRNRVEWEPLIGFFINTVALRTKVARDLPFSKLVGRVQETALEAHEHQEVPFEHVVAAVQRERDPARPPVVQVMFVLHNTPRYEAACPGLSLSASEITGTSAKFDLILAVQEEEDAFRLRMEYCTALYRRETAEQVLAQYEALLEDAIVHPDRAVGRLQLSAVEPGLAPQTGPAAERPATPSGYGSLHEVFEQRAAETPDAPAVTCEGTTLTYAQLNARSNQLAHYLMDNGVAPGVLVGLCLDRSIDTVTAILAVLKADGAYVPMDPVYPRERVRMIVDDADCAMVIAHKAQAARFEDSRAKVIVLDALEAPWAAYPETNPPHVSLPDNLAYVIYTSGSTGKPKGALITHENVCRLITEMEPWFDIGPDEVWTLFHSYAFDFSVWEMWGAYFHGGRLVVIPHLVSRSPEQFYQLLLDEQVTVLNQTPSAFRQLQLHDETLPLETARRLALRYVIFGGEVLDLPGLKPWFDRHGDQRPRLVNMYGITETTVFVTYRPVTLADTRPGTPNFIGIPIPDLKLYVLDENGRPVKTGEAGELYVGGPGVGRGYLRRPELTAERFVPDPLAGNGKPEIFYKTGDLVRVHEGDLEFLGRNDMQVQLRGFRVELGEIETALNTHAAVRGAAVRMREDAPGDQRLVAYYLAREALPVEALRQHLGATLPPYMIPAAFERLDAFPLNNNGKLDMDALPVPGAATAAAAASAAPETDTEKKLAELWCELLRIDSSGVDDNFFALGGHSLLAIQVLAKLNDTFKTKLTLADFFETSTIRGLAVRIDGGEAMERQRQGGGEQAPERRELFMLKGGEGEPFFCASGAGDVVGSYAPLAQALREGQPFYCFSDRLLEQSESDDFTIESMAANLVSYIRSVKPSGPYILGGYSFGGVLAFEAAKQLLEAGESVPGVIMLDTSAVLDGAETRTFGLKAVRYWSRRLLVRAWATLYTWKLQMGYLRDLPQVLFRKPTAPDGRGAPRLRECLQWIWYDTLNQYFMIHAGLYAARISDRRLEMIRETTIQQTTRRIALMSSSQNAYFYTRIPTKVVLIRVAHDPWCEARLDETLGWRQFAGHGVDVHVIPGNHFVMHREPFVRELGKCLQQNLDKLSTLPQEDIGGSNNLGT